MKKTEEIYHQKVDYKGIVLHFLSYKFLFAACLVLFLGVAYLFNKFSKPVYENSTSILVNKKNLYSFLSSEDLMDSYGQFYKKETQQDELGILQSYTLVNDAITKINAMVSYYTEESLIKDNTGGVKVSNELYNKAPFFVKLDKFRAQPIDIPFNVKLIDGNSFELSVHGEKIWLYDYQTGRAEEQVSKLDLSGVYKYGDVIESDYFRFKIEKQDVDLEAYVGKSYLFAFNNLSYLTQKYKSALRIEAADNNSSIFIISMSGENPDKVTDFLNALTGVYLEMNLQKKNRIVDNTIEFIDKQISNITDSLVYTENRLQNFRSKYKVTDLSFQGEKIYEKMNELETQKAQLVVQLKYYKYIKAYFKRNKDASDLVAPSAMSVEDAVLSKLIADLTSLYTERSGMLQTGKNIFLEEIENKIGNLKATILENVQNNLNKTQIEINDINRRLANLNAEIEQLPKTERELFGIERKFKLNDAIYTFLLQKRAEAQIAKASNSPDYEVIDQARIISAYIVSPKKRLNYLIALFLGFFLPVVFILLKDFFRSHIDTTHEPLVTAGYPMIGSVLRGSRRRQNAIMEEPHSLVAESIRMICTNLQFSPQSKSILISSTTENEGKTYNAINMAFALAEMGRKTLLVDLDLRKPQIAKYLKVKIENGIGSYLEAGKDLGDVKIKDYTENLDLVVNDVAIENPLAIFNSDLLKNIIDKESKQYDHIIFDTPGIGEHPEALLLMRFCDAVVFVARNKKTNKKEFCQSLDGLKGKEFDHVYVLLNHVKKSRKTFK